MNKIFRSIKDFVERSEYADKYPDIFDDEDIFDLEKFNAKRKMIEESEKNIFRKNNDKEDKNELPEKAIKSEDLEENTFEREFFDESNFPNQIEETIEDAIIAEDISYMDSEISLGDIAKTENKIYSDSTAIHVVKELKGDQALRKVKEAFIYNEILNNKRRR